MVVQPPPNLAEEGGIEAGIGPLQAEPVVPIDATAYRIGRLAIWQGLRTRSERHGGQPTRGNGRLPSCGKQVRTIVIADERAELIREPEIRRAVGKARLGHTRGLSGHSILGTWVSRHRRSPWGAVIMYSPVREKLCRHVSISGLGNMGGIPQQDQN